MWTSLHFFRLLFFGNISIAFSPGAPSSRVFLSFSPFGVQYPNLHSRGTQVVPLPPTNYMSVSGWRIPNRRRVGAFLERHRGAGQWLDTEALGVVGGPARRGDFEDTGIVKGALFDVEI